MTKYGKGRSKRCVWEVEASFGAIVLAKRKRKD
ncbi:uncharacterized protein G2W53_001927 [Senna tora]|uniref:Uncharacterized protein n=1 Tax=Senna tora TaxID=362788 RepID=A0A834XH73_9FABA|nr:uncharacterized protein G2W53_001927 [Senna tora]